MALIKYHTDDQITTQLGSNTIINDVLKIDNKELLLVSLLEKLCQNLNSDNHLFNNICQYLTHIGLLENRNLYTDNHKAIRQMYVDYLIGLISQNHEPNDNGINSFISINNLKVNNSLYAMNFTELQLLGSGGFGSVYKVLNKIDMREYAVKIVPFINVDDPNNIRAFNEVRCLSELTHENIARYYTSWLELTDKITLLVDDNEDTDSDIDDEANQIIQCVKPHEKINIYPVMYIQMELCTGNLKNFMDNRNKLLPSGFIQDFTIEKQIIKGIIKGMTYIHSKNILHRDLNPNNIFMDLNNLPKIGDFGMAIKQINNPKTQSIMSSGYGVSLYRPPEYENDNIYTFKSDVYSTGLILFDIVYVYKTEMEHYKVLSMFKEKHIHDMCDSNMTPYLQVIINMTNKNPIYRPNFSDIVDFD